MCRHLAYVGPPASLRSLLIDPPHSLYRQAWAPRLQRHGTVNADGFGVGWYADGDPVPARYRRGVPVWGDPSLPDIARVTRSGAVLAAVRSATEGTALGEQAAAPFGHERWMFSHNGLLDGWPESAVRLPARAWGTRDLRGGAEADECGDRPASAGSVPDAPGVGVLLSLEAMVDSAFLWGLVLRRLRTGSAMDAALAETITAIEAGGGTGRFNFLLTDGRTIAATARGDTLWYRRSAGAVTVASEPDDDGPGWTEVADRHVLTATAGRLDVRPIGTPTDCPSLGRVSTTESDVSTEGIFAS